MTNNIEAQTKALSDQVSLLEQLAVSGDDEKYHLELEKYNLMLKGADFSLASQAAAKKRKLTLADKLLAPQVNKVTRQINKVNKKLVKYNKKRGSK
jgi:hypothetical protein